MTAPMRAPVPLLRALVGLAGLAGLAWLATDAVAASDCSFPADCFGTERAGLTVLFGTLLSVGLSALPIVGTGKDLIEAITGRDMVTGERLAGWERLLNVVSAPLGILPGAGAIDEAASMPRVVRAADEAFGAAHEVGAAARGVDELAAAAPASRLATEGATWKPPRQIDLERYPTQATPTSAARNRFEIEHTGPNNYRVAMEDLPDGSAREIWADGIRAEDGFLLDAKHVGNPGSSPYIDGSRAPDFVRDSARSQFEHEVRRYSSLIWDSDAPFRGLEIITNDANAARYFEEVLVRYNVPGRVVVVP
jgi:hypothetical protein